MTTESDMTVQSHEAEDTREKILAAARKLFAEKGFDITSVRDITNEAGCNVASVNYHFGGKDKLYVETFRSMLKELREQRLGVLDELLSRDQSPTFEEFLTTFAEGFIDPLVGDVRGRLFVAMVSREMFDPRLPHNVFLNEFIHPVLDRSMTALNQFGPELEPDVARMCIMSMVGQLLHALKTHHLFTSDADRPVTAPDLAGYLSHFVQYSAAGIRACSEQPQAEPEPSLVSEVTT